MPRISLRLALAAGAVALMLAGCGTSSGDDAADDPTTTSAKATTTAPVDTTKANTTETTEAADPSGPDEGGDICVPLKVLSDFDSASARLINAGDWTVTQEFFVANTDEVLNAYDDAIALDTEMTADLKALRAVTEATSDTAARSDDLAEFSAGLLDQPGIMEAGASGFALNTFAEENCGFSTGGQSG